MHLLARTVRWGRRVTTAARLASRHLFPVALAALALAAQAQESQSGDVPVVVLTPDARGIPLAGKIGVLVDESGKLGIEQIRSPEVEQRFKVEPGPVEVGFDEAPRWFKIRFRQDARIGEWLLAMASRNVSDMQFFGPFDESAGRALAQPVVTGTSHPYATRYLGHERFSFRIQLPEPGVFTVYLRLKSEFPQTYTPSVWELSTFAEVQQDGRLIDGISYGVIFGLMLYALLMFLTFRDRIYLFFLVAAFWALATLAMLNGHVARYLFPNVPAIAERISIVVPALWVTFTMLFGRRFLYMRRYAPVIGWIALALALLSLLCALAALAGQFWWTSLVIASVAAVGLMIMPIAARQTQKVGYGTTGWYLLATVVLFVSVLVLLASSWAMLSPALVLNNYLQAAIVAETALFSIALGQRLPRMWLLHGQLHDRAAELTRAAQTDPLTRVANRAGLSNRALDLLDSDKKCSLLILDLDHFKPINDQFGHDTGDEVLMRVARRLQRLAGPDDTVARLGGDEFAVLLTHLHEREELDRFAERVINSIGSPIEIGDRTHQVGASIGIAQFPENGEDLSRLMRRADLALYRVKRRGRNGWAFFEDLPPNTSSFADL
ncbi:MAG: diguanylate cyclase [Burkholderiales bacterium]